MPKYLPKRYLTTALKIICIFLLLFFAKKYFFKSEADKIREMLSSLSKSAELAAVTPPIVRIAEVKNAAAHFASTVEGEIDLKDDRKEFVKPRKELEQLAVAAKSTFSKLEFLILPIRISVDGNQAQVSGEAHVLGSMPNNEGQFYERHAVTLELRKENKRWIIWKVSTENLRE